MSGVACSSHTRQTSRGRRSHKCSKSHNQSASCLCDLTCPCPCSTCQLFWTTATPVLRRLPTPRLANRYKFQKPPIFVYTWGRGDLGELGLGDENNREVPSLVTGLLDKDIVHVAASEYHTAFLTGEGEIYATGLNEYGQLGVKGRDSQLVPVRVEALDTYTITHIACGQNHTAAVTDTGSLASWGLAEYGQLGQKEAENTVSVQQPRIVKGTRDLRFVRVACGANHTVGLTGNGDVYTCGQGLFGALGHGNVENKSAPTLVDALWGVGIVQIACGETHTAALTWDGKVYTWGRGKYGQLGLGHTNNKNRPVHVPTPKPVCQIACGGDHTAAILEDGSLYAWGHGVQTGIGRKEDVLRPRRVNVLASHNISFVTAGMHHTIAMTESNDVYGWGSTEQGQLAKVGSAEVLLPTPLTGLPEGQNLLFIVASGDHTVAVFQERRGEGSKEEVLEEQMDDGEHTERQEGEPSTQNVQGEDEHTQRQKGELLTQNLKQGTQSSRLASIPESTTDGHQMMEIDVSKKDDGDGSIAESARRDKGASGPSSPASSSYATSSKWPASKLAGVMPSGLFTDSSVSHSTPEMQPLSRPLHGSSPDKPSEPAEKWHSSPEDEHSRNGGITRGKRPSNGRSLSSEDDPCPLQDGAHGLGLRPLKVPFRILQLIQNAKDSHSNMVVMVHAMEDLFSSIAFLPAEFRLRPSGHRADAEIPGPGLDVELIKQVYASLWQLCEPEIIAKLGAAIQRVLDGLKEHMDLVPETRWNKVLLILLQCPLIGEKGLGDAISTQLFDVFLRIPRSMETKLVQWLRTYPREIFGGRFLRSVHKYISKREHLLTRREERPAREIVAAVKVMSILQEANKPELVSYTEFYSVTISEHADLVAEFRKWRHYLARGERDGFVSFCQTPFLLMPEAKCRILQVEAEIEKQSHQQHALAEFLFAGDHHFLNPYLILRVNRDQLVSNTLAQLQFVAKSPRDLKKPLKVIFEGEEGVDEGGVKKEFFQLLIRDLFNVSFGMFTYNEETRTFWFNRNSIEAEDEFQLVGIILGLAIYNGVILDVHFPQVVYKKLVGLETVLADLRDLQPDIERSFLQLLQFQGNVQEIHGLCFQVEYEFFGEIRTHDLLPGGAYIPVTEENKDRYVTLYAKYILQDSIENQFSAFLNGFKLVCNGKAMELFRYEELELLICGLPHFDFVALEECAMYMGFTKESQAIRWFWEVVHSMSLEEKKKLLFFTTGCDRAPVGGLSKLRFVIQRMGPDTNRLPTAHTCFNILLLPDYSSKEKLKNRLLLAIKNTTGFGLQ